MYSCIKSEATGPDGTKFLAPFGNEGCDLVVQSIVSLTSSFRGQLLKCLTTLYQIHLYFLLKKMREAFALQKLLTFFQQKMLAYLRY